MSTIREAKRRVVREALSTAARELVLANGLDAVTVEDIATAAGVSTRTFFNYFPGKDDAIVGVEPERIEEQVRQLIDRPASETPKEALHAVVFHEEDTARIPDWWEQHNELVHRHPALFPRYLASISEIEGAFATAIANRAGIDPERDPRPHALVASALGVLRATISWWLTSDREEDLHDVLEAAYWDLVVDLPSAPLEGPVATESAIS